MSRVLASGGPAPGTTASGPETPPPKAAVIIHHFASNQNDVFIPALLALLVATVLVCLPIVFREPLRRSGRRGPVLGVLVALAVVALGVTVWQAGTGFATLGSERARVQADIRSRYGIALDGGQVGELVDGGKPKVALPTQAAALGLASPEEPKTLRLKAESPDGDRYDLLLGGKPLPVR
jgi:hypothetical protein